MHIYIHKEDEYGQLKLILVFNLVEISNFDESEKIQLDVFIYINGSKVLVYPWESFFSYFIQSM